MLIDFSTLPEYKGEKMNGGDGCVFARMYNDPMNRIIISRLPKGSSIGIHTHVDSSDINYVISGIGEATCDGVIEHLSSGVCHYCPKGSSHSIRNTGDEDLVLFTVVPKQ